MTQKEWIKKQPTDYLLCLRRAAYIHVPQNEGDQPIRVGDAWGYPLDKKLLYDELATRPHRVRAKDRRKPKKDRR